MKYSETVCNLLISAAGPTLEPEGNGIFWGQSQIFLESIQ